MEQISVVGCRSWDYKYEEVREAIQRSFDLLGGAACFVAPGERVLLKVNLVMKKQPEAAATSHPVFVQALAEILAELGAEVIIGDSPGGPFNEVWLRNVYQGCGMRSAAEKSGAVLNFDTGSSQVPNPEGLLLKRLTNIDILRKVDKVINVAKLKTHGMMKMTGAVKNLFGTVPGTMKAEYHLNRPEPAQFADALIDICLCAAPTLSFIDGIVGMEGDGPTSGTPRNVGVVLAAKNPYHLDLAAARIINVPPQTVPTVERSIARGLCPADYRELTLVGDRLEDFAVPDFKAPAVKLVNPLRGNVPAFMRHFVNRWGQPYPEFLHEKCIRCGDCARSCPPGAIAMEGETEKLPRVELEKCIRCFCCQELCPKAAVEIKRPWLFRLLARL